MGAGTCGRVHFFATGRAGKLKLRPTMITLGRRIGDPLATCRTKGLAAVGALIFAQVNQLVAGRAKQSSWNRRFVISSAAAAGAILFTRQ